MSSGNGNNMAGDRVDLAGLEGSGLGEEVVLAWIEGTLAREEDARLSREHPELARGVRLMRGDRASLAALGTARAPASISLGVMERLSASAEREMLLGVARAESQAPVVEIPVSRVRVRREGVLAKIGGGRLAAGLVLACGAAFLTWRAVRAPGDGGIAPPGRVTTAMDAGDGVPGPIGANEVAREVGREVGLADAGSATRAGSTAGAALAKAEATLDEPGWDPEPAGEISLASVAMPAERAVALAREGRLLVRVVATSPRARVESVRASDAGAWRWDASVPTAMASAVTGWRDERTEQSPPVWRPERALMSTLEARDGMPGFLAPSLPPPTPTVGARTLAVDCELCEGSLGELRDRLAKVDGVAAVEFVELDASLGAARESPRAERLLWWTQPTGQWSPRATLPVLVDSGP